MADADGPGTALIASNDDPPPTRPLSAISLYLEHNYDELQEEFGELEEESFKVEVKKKFKALAKEVKSKFKDRAKRAKAEYYQALEVYLISHPSHEIDDKDRAGLEKQRLKRSQEEAELEEAPVPRKKKKKKRRLRDGGEDGMGMDDVEGFDMIDPNQPEYEEVPPIPVKTGKRRKKELTTEEDDAVKSLLEKMCRTMKEAADKDRNLNKVGLPAVEKIKLLRGVIKNMEISHFHVFLIEKLEILDVIRDWLTVLPDGSLPELNIRNEMYRILELFKLDKFESDDLRDYFLMSVQRTQTLISQDPSKNMFQPFCKTIKYLCKHPKETPENRKRLTNLIMKWCAPLIGHTQRSSVTRENPNIVAARNKAIRSRTRYVDTLESKRARLPQKPWFDFARNASKSDDMDNMGGRGMGDSDKRANIVRTFRNLSKTVNKQYAKPSVSGRKKFT